MLFFDSLSSLSTLTCELRSHRAGSQLKIQKIPERKQTLNASRDRRPIIKNKSRKFSWDLVPAISRDIFMAVNLSPGARMWDVLRRIIRSHFYNSKLYNWSIWVWEQNWEMQEKEWTRWAGRRGWLVGAMHPGLVREVPSFHDKTF